MKLRRNLNQAGFIPMILTILLIIAAIIYIAYTRVAHANH